MINALKWLYGYLGVMRAYSSIDLAFNMLAVGANVRETIGCLCLMQVLMAYLESRHRHPYRVYVPRWMWVIFAAPGLWLFQKLHQGEFFVATYIYTRKNKPYMGLVSPFARAWQVLALVGGITGYFSLLPWYAAGLAVIRNILGDSRDTEKDRAEGYLTWPVLLGQKKDWKYAHFGCLLLTTWVWWRVNGFAPNWLYLAWAAQAATYWLTPR